MRNMSSSDVCICCQGIIEYSLHILRDCPKAIEIWEHFGVNASFFNILLHQWLHSNLTHKPPHSQIQISLPSKILFPFMLWSIWKRRNSCIFNQTQTTMDKCILEGQALAWEFHTSRNNTLSANPPTISPITWIPPVRDRLKLNYDTSFVNVGVDACVAGVFRDYLEDWVVGFS